jgi:hypothetical protein
MTVMRVEYADVLTIQDSKVPDLMHERRDLRLASAVGIGVSA